MMKARVQVLGAYKVELTDQLFKKALKLKFGEFGREYLNNITGERRSFVESAEKQVSAELSSIVLLEVLVENADKQFDVGDFRQPDSDQIAYDEAFLSVEGTTLLSRFEPPQGDSFRVAFFLHFFDTQKPLLTSYGEAFIPDIQKMPNRLRTLMPYEPVD